MADRGPGDEGPGTGNHTYPLALIPEKKADTGSVADSFGIDGNCSSGGKFQKNRTEISLVNS